MCGQPAVLLLTAKQLQRLYRFLGFTPRNEQVASWGPLFRAEAAKMVRFISAHSLLRERGEKSEQENEQTSTYSARGTEALSQDEKVAKQTSSASFLWQQWVNHESRHWSVPLDKPWDLTSRWMVQTHCGWNGRKQGELRSLHTGQKADQCKRMTAGQSFFLVHIARGEYA